jgi:Uma2 family endonuclease
MTTLLTARVSAEQTRATDTLADLLNRLGDISPDRVRLHPPLGTATIKDVVDIQAHEKRLFELINGVLVEKGMGYRESLLAGAILAALREWIVPRNLGLVSGESGMMQLLPDQVRMPDVAFASWARFPDGKVPIDPVPHLVPDLTVEVLSKSNTAAEITRKRREYFEAGVRLVWIVDLPTRTVTVFTGPEQSYTLREDQTLTGEPVLPGFTLSLAKLFAELDNLPKLA